MDINIIYDKFKILTSLKHIIILILFKKKIVVTGGEGRFASVLKKTKSNYDYLFPSKKTLNILNVNSIRKYIQKYKPKYLLHCAGLSRPMIIHETNFRKSIDINIIGTANVTKICSKLKYA